MATNANNAQAVYNNNIAARNVVLNASVPMMQPLQSTTINPTQQNVINFTPRNVGLLTGFLIRVSGGVTVGATTTVNRTNFGSANALTNITYTDLNGVQRINTTGWHLALLNSAKQGFVFGGAYAPNVPMNYGNNWSPFTAPATIAGAGTGTVTHTYFVPIARSANDLTGSIYTNVLDASQNLQITINPNPFTAAGDPLSAIYSGNTGSWTSTVTVTVYQLYRDQIPMVNGAPLLPMIDLNTVYSLKNTTLSGLVVGQEFPYTYANQQSFLSTIAVFDNGGTFNSGSDVNYFNLRSANQTILWQADPNTLALLARQTFMADPPPGVYYFDTNSRPIVTSTYGNMQLNLNASTVNANAALLVAVESLQMTAAIPISSSLAAG